MSLHPLIIEVLPAEHTGTATNTSTKRKCNDRAGAEEQFRLSVGRLLNVNQWNKVAGAASANFQLMDRQGNPVNRNVQKGDYFQIDIPGPGSKGGQGNDWVEVEEIGSKQSADARMQFFRVRASAQPQAVRDEPAHFFASSATSTFVVLLDNQEVLAGVYGRNEKPNVDTISLADKIRNTITAIGAILGLSKAQWKAFTQGLVQDDRK